MKNKKRGITFSEILVAVALTAILAGIIGPITRFYTKLSTRLNVGLSEKVELENVYSKIQSIINGIPYEDKWGNANKVKNAGIGVEDNFATDISSGIKNGNQYSDVQHFHTLVNNSQSTNKAELGNTAYFITTEYNELTGNLLELYHVFRFVNNGEGKTVMTYANTMDKSKEPLTIPKHIGKNDNIIFNDEIEYLPSGGGIKELVRNKNGDADKNYFIEVTGGIIIHLEYYIDPELTSGKNDPSNIIVEEKLFLKRGDV